MTKRERLRLDRQYREERLAWRRQIEAIFNLKPAPELPLPGVLDAVDPEAG